jgi:hypothetical protein
MRRIFVLGGGMVLLGATVAACGSSKGGAAGSGGASGAGGVSGVAGAAGVGASSGTAGTSLSGGGGGNGGDGALGMSGAVGYAGNSGEAGQNNAGAAGANDLGAGGAPDCNAGDLKCGSATELDVCSPRGVFVKSADCDLQCGTVAGNAECVECTSGDALCPGGCTKPEDDDCAAETLSGCPNIFLGLGRYQAPQPKDVSNTSIAATATLKVGVTEILTVTVYNHGTDDSPTVQLQVLWGDPSDGCVGNLHPIDSRGLLGVPGATDAQTPGSTGVNIGWTPDATALATNGGHVCLLARVYDTTAPTRAGCVQQNNNSVTPETDPLSAVFELQILPGN